MEPEEEPQHKRPHLNNHDFSMARHSASPPPDEDKPVSYRDWCVFAAIHFIPLLITLFEFVY